LAFDLISNQTGEQRRYLLGSIGQSLVEHDPDHALEWFSSLEDPKELSSALGGARGTLHHVNPEQFAALLEQLPDDEREDIGGDFIGQWAAEDPESARTWVQGVEDPEQREVYIESMVGNLTWDDPALAIDIITRAQAEDVDLENPTQYAFSTLARRDLEAARGLIDTLEVGDTRDQATRAIVGAWAEQDPRAAAAFVDAQGFEGVERRDMLRQIADQWAERDPDEVLDWAGGLPIGERASISNEAIRELVNDDQLDRARSVLEGLIGDPEAVRGDRLSGAINSVVGKVASEDPEAGIALINQLPTEDSQRHAIGVLAGNWADDDLEGASTWVANLPAGVVRDAAVERVVREHLDESENFERGFDLASSLGNAEQRRELIRRTVSQWARRDQEATRAAIDASDLPEGERQRLIDRLE